MKEKVEQRVRRVLGKYPTATDDDVLFFVKFIKFMRHEIAKWKWAKRTKEKI